MGISGLLPLLKSIQRPTELKKFSGETFAVDAYGWLHRGAISCAIELAQGKPTRRYVDFAMHRVRMVKYFGVTPYMVFDGDFLPSKALTEASRAKRREESRKAGVELLKAGKPSQAHQELQKAIDVTPEMARHLIEELKKAEIPYVVAPYEADAQMVYLERQGLITGIISEDSDLLVFGAKRLLTKLDQHGQCVEIKRRDFCACREVSLAGWTDREFRQMAILSGCDYLDGIGNMGLKTAYRMIRKYKSPERVVRMLQFDGKYRISENYLACFKQAELTFLHQRVYCPKKQELVLLTEPDSGLDVEEMPFIGAKVDRDLAQAIALGDVNPISKEPIVLAGLPEKRGSKQAAPVSNSPQSRLSGKPIDSYFKGHRRIPMAEMDPNCFAVEPRQVAALTQNGLTPRIFPLPRPYLDETNASHSSDTLRPYTSPRLQRRRTEPTSNLLRRDASSSSTRRRTAGPTVRTSDDTDHLEGPLSTRPAKKARLCDDVGLDGSPKKELERSKFFPVGSGVKSRPKKSDPILTSDDSIEEALLSLPDVDSWNSSRSGKSSQCLDIFQEETQITIPDSPTPASMVNVHEETVPRSDIKVPASSPPHLRSVDKVVESKPSEAENTPSLKCFSYTPAARNGTRFANGLPTPDSSVQGSMTKYALPTTSAPLLTPLQRIGQQALKRVTPSGTPPSVLKGMRPQSGKRRSVGKPSVATFPVNPSFVPLPKVDLDEVEALNRLLGSEDQIIPDSDGENELPALDEPAPEQPPSRLDLSRFLYT